MAQMSALASDMNIVASTPLLNKYLPNERQTSVKMGHIIQEDVSRQTR